MVIGTLACSAWLSDAAVTAPAPAPAAAPATNCWLARHADFQWLGTYGIDYHMGTNETRLQLDAGVAVEDIVKSWGPGLSVFLQTRQKYLLY